VTAQTGAMMLAPSVASHCEWCATSQLIYKCFWETAGKNQLTQTASKIPKINIPSVYKGKGIRLVNKIIFENRSKR